MPNQALEKSLADLLDSLPDTDIAIPKYGSDPDDDALIVDKDPVALGAAPDDDEKNPRVTKTAPLAKYQSKDINPKKELQAIEKLVRENYKTPDQVKGIKPKPKDSDEMMEGIIKTCQAITNPEEQAAWLKALRDGLDLQRVLILDQKNVKLQMERQEDPTKVEILDFSDQQLDAISPYPQNPSEEKVGAWGRLKKAFGAALLPDRLTGQTEAQKMHFRKNRQPQLSGRLTKKSVATLNEAGEDVQKEQEANDRNIQSLIQNKIIRQEEIEKSGSFAGDVLRTNVGRLKKVVEVAGKGIISESKAEDSRAWEEFAKFRDDEFKARVHSFHPQKASPFHKELVAITRDPTSNGLLTDVQFNDVVKLLEKYDKLEDKEHKNRIIALNAEITKASEEFLNKEQDHLKKEDAMWKFRVMQAVLLCSPFAPLSLVGPLLNVIAPFIHGGSFASFVSSFANINIVPFSYITEPMHLDKAVDWVMNGPLGFVSQTMDFMFHNDITKPIISNLVPLVGSEVAGVMFGLAASIYRTPTEIEHYQEGQKILTEGKKSITSKMESTEKSAKAATESMIKKMVSAKLPIGEKACLAGKATEFLKTNSVLLLNDPKISKFITDDPNELKELQDLVGSFTPLKLASHLYSNPALVDKILLIQALYEKDPTTLEAELIRLESKKDESDKIIKNQTRKLTNEFYIDQAVNHLKIMSKTTCEDKLKLHRKLTAAENNGKDETDEEFLTRQEITVAKIKNKIIQIETERMIRNDAEKVVTKKTLPTSSSSSSTAATSSSTSSSVSTTSSTTTSSSLTSTSASPPEPTPPPSPPPSSITSDNEIDENVREEEKKNNEIDENVREEEKKNNEIDENVREEEKKNNEIDENVREEEKKVSPPNSSSSSSTTIRTNENIFDEEEEEKEVDGDDISDINVTEKEKTKYSKETSHNIPPSSSPHQPIDSSIFFGDLQETKGIDPTTPVSWTQRIKGERAATPIKSHDGSGNIGGHG